MHLNLIFDIKLDVYRMKVWFGNVKISYLPRWNLYVTESNFHSVDIKFDVKNQTQMQAILLREKLKLSPPQKLPVSYVFLWSAALTSPVYGIISWCSMCRLLQTSDSANLFLKIQVTCTSMSIIVTFWDVYTKFEITRDVNCDQIS